MCCWSLLTVSWFTPDDMGKTCGANGIIINLELPLGRRVFSEKLPLVIWGRSAGIQCMTSLKCLETGATVTYSSDVIGMCEEQRGNPWFGMEISATRVDLEDPLDPEKYPGSVRPPLSARLTPEQLVDGYTRTGAIPSEWKM